jgi:hypothetical protein
MEERKKSARPASYNCILSSFQHSFVKKVMGLFIKWMGLFIKWYYTLQWIDCQRITC